MKGLWKNELGGWSKDTKRKKQTRRHHIKDNGKALWKIYIAQWKKSPERKVDSDIYFNDCDLEEVTYRGRKKIEYAEVWKIEVNGKVHFAWTTDRTIWYDDYTNESIEISSYDDIYYPYIKKLEFIESVPFDDEKWVKPRESKNDIDGNEFFLGKPLMKKDINWGNGRRGKIAQKFSHKRDRRIMRDWILQGDWEKERQTHHTSKSLLWELW